jgi:hypothetical protein
MPQGACCVPLPRAARYGCREPRLARWPPAPSAMSEDSYSSRTQDRLCQASGAFSVSYPYMLAACIASPTWRARRRAPRRPACCPPQLVKTLDVVVDKVPPHGQERTLQSGSRYAQAGAIKIRRNIPEPSAPSPGDDPDAGHRRWSARAPRVDPSHAGGIAAMMDRRLLVPGRQGRAGRTPCGVDRRWDPGRAFYKIVSCSRRREKSLPEEQS